jgi:hypothetical protein
MRSDDLITIFFGVAAIGGGCICLILGTAAVHLLAHLFGAV